MDTSKATPKLMLPWAYAEGEDNTSYKKKSDKHRLGSIVDAQGYYIARIWADCPDALQKAEYLVSAVNSYDALRAENKALREACEAALKVEGLRFTSFDGERRVSLAISEWDAVRDLIIAALGKEGGR